jgi:site-specific recombinase XerD
MLKYTVRLLLWKHRATSTGAHPITIAITFHRKITYISTPYKVLEKYWDDNLKEVKAGFPDYKNVNIDLRKTVSEIERMITAKSIDGKQVSGQIIKDELKGGTSGRNFFEYAEELRRYKDGSNVKGSRINYQKEINRLKEFAGSYLAISSIDATTLRKYEQYERGRKMSQNTINTTFKWLRTILTHAYKEGVIKSNPFDNFSIPKYVQSERTFLEKDERDAWVKYWRERKVDGSLYNTLTYFLLGVFSGLRFSDWGKASSMVAGDLLRLRPLKTRKSGKWVVLPIGPTLREILDVVARIPIPISDRKTRDNLKILAGRLETPKHITTHVARHSFATMCAENRIPKSVTAELMGVTVDTVEIYYHLTGQSIAEQAAVLRTI